MMTIALLRSRPLLLRLRVVFAALLLASMLLPGRGVASPGVDADYPPVTLPSFVDQSRTPAGQRIILRPTPVSFVATIHRMPEQQTTRYLKQVMNMMQVSAAGDVSQRIVVRYGDNQYLPLYINDEAAARLGEQAQAGEQRRFYALHVYNYSKGPALIVVSFGGRE